MWSIYARCEPPPRVRARLCVYICKKLVKRVQCTIVVNLRSGKREVRKTRRQTGEEQERRFPLEKSAPDRTLRLRTGVDEDEGGVKGACVGMNRSTRKFSSINRARHSRISTARGEAKKGEFR